MDSVAEHVYVDLLCLVCVQICVGMCVEVAQDCDVSDSYIMISILFVTW